ncbi:MAG: TolC family protein [Acidobacteria bacterium]|nr:TolC family protein [Acidobacteriota bacterium]
MRIAILALLLALQTVDGQQVPGPLTISRSVALAVERYPSVRVSEEQLAAARGAISLARTAYLPRLDGYAQLNRATHNNVFGMLTPQTTIPAISGPVTPASLNNVWGSAVGALITWEPFDFGLRQANVAVGDAGVKRAEAASRRTRFEVAALAADAYLTLAAADEMERAAQAGVDRAVVLEKVVAAVVNAGLRPGADLSRTRAELALAETQVAQARQAVAMARASLSQLVGVPASDIAIVPGKMLETPAAATPGGDVAQHPRAVEQQAAIDEVKARERALDRSWRPRFSLQGAAFGRGTGAHTDGASGAEYSGLGPNTGNWAIGFSVFFPLFDFASLRVKRDVESHNERAEAARLDLVIRELGGQRDRAAAQLEGARQIARNVPVQLQAARDAEQQATARYKAGLGAAVEVADAQRLLTQSEIDDALAKLNVWRAMLSAAVASGNLDDFLDRTQ